MPINKKYVQYIITIYLTNMREGNILSCYINGKEFMHTLTKIAMPHQDQITTLYVGVFLLSHTHINLAWPHKY